MATSTKPGGATVATRSWMFICVVILAIAMFFTRESARGQGPTFDRAMVLEAMKLSGRQNDIGELPDTVTRVYVATIKSQHRGMSEQELDEISKSVEAYVSAKAKESDLEGQLVAIYERHLTPEDVAQLAAFLRSESGKRYMTAMPVILEESGDLGKRWVESINPGIQAEVSKYLH